MKNAKKLTKLAMLTAVAIAVYWAESRLPPIAPVPGIKLGLANAVTLFVLICYGAPSAAMVSLGRILLGGFAAGSFSTLLYSLAGGAVSLAVMAVVYNALRAGNAEYNALRAGNASADAERGKAANAPRFRSQKPTSRLTTASVFAGAVGGTAHNIAQLSVAVAVTETPELFAYLPILIIAGVVTGAFTGLCAGYAARRLEDVL
ncbi:MAG: Gx transporter family protein [Oscillospiraceae bacterium]|jgi:heptaprenyl diphosphate synthase|nr:Gx transporter family protein [Oscillospiraceae bacterium]